MKKKAPAARAMAKTKNKLKKHDCQLKNAFDDEQKKRLRRAHWRKKKILKQYKNIEKSIECLLEGWGWEGEWRPFQQTKTTSRL